MFIMQKAGGCKSSTKKGQNDVSNKQVDKLLESMVEEALLREDEGDDSGGYPSGIYDDYYSSQGGGGIGLGGDTASGMYRAFIQPLTDIVGSGMNAIQTLTVLGQEMLKNLLTNVPKLLVPWLKTEDYASMRNKQDQAVAFVKNQYADILKRNEHYLKDHDLWGFYFLMDPSLMLGTQLVDKAPDFAVAIIDLLGFKNLRTYRPQKLLLGPRAIRADEGVEHIQEGTQENQQIRELFKDPKVLEALKNNPQVAAVRKAVLKGMVDEVKIFMSIPSFEQLMEKGNGKFSLLQQYLNTSYQNKKVTPQDIEGLKQGLLGKFKEEYKKHYVDLLRDAAKKTPSAQTDINAAIEQIQSIK